jgi:hypothetical protein
MFCSSFFPDHATYNNVGPTLNMFRVFLFLLSKKHAKNRLETVRGFKIDLLRSRKLAFLRVLLMLVLYVVCLGVCMYVCVFGVCVVYETRISHLLCHHRRHYCYYYCHLILDYYEH